MLGKSLLIFILLFTSSLLSANKTITIAGTADLQGMMEASTQKFDLNKDGKKEKVVMGGIANIASTFKSMKKEDP